MASGNSEFLQAMLGRTGQRVFRLGLSATYRPGERAVREGIDAGMNYLFWYFTDVHMTRALREVLPARRENFVIATGCSNFGDFWIRRSVEGALRRLRTDYVDVFHVFWVGPGKLRPGSIELLQKYREQGKIRSIAISTHARQYAGELVRQGLLDVLMMRYNAAHRGAEQEIFPHLAASNPGVVSYTATRWTFLLRRPRGWPQNGRVPTAGECYRFALSHPHVHVCLTAPRNAQELRDNLAATTKGPLDEEDMKFMREFGDVVHRQKRFFL